MPQEQAAAEENYRRFIAQVRESGEVWGLRSGPDWAYCESHEYEETDVLVFWSDRAAAQQHAQGEWKQHRPVAIPLEEFVDEWLLGMDKDRALVGPNWGLELDGLEVEPLDLADQLSEDEPT